MPALSKEGKIQISSGAGQKKDQKVKEQAFFRR